MTDDIDISDMPNLVPGALRRLDIDALKAPDDPGHPPRILMLYGSLREVSYSRLVAEEGRRALEALGCEVRIYDPHGLPLVDDDVDASHEKVAELREMALWSEGMVWSSPERHGAMTGVMKTQIDWLPLSPIGGVRPTQGKTLALCQVSGGSQSFNALNQMRVLGRWMRMLTIPNQSSVPQAFLKFEKGRMMPGSHYNRIVDVMEELARFTWMVRGRKDGLVDRYSERVESLEAVHKRVSKM